MDVYGRVYGCCMRVYGRVHRRAWMCIDVLMDVRGCAWMCVLMCVDVCMDVY